MAAEVNTAQISAPSSADSFSAALLAPVIILIRPQLPENLGTVARGMMNFGLHTLRLVNPLCAPDDAKACATATGAESLLKEAKQFSSLQEATKDLHKLYGTAARERELIKPYFSLRQGLQEERKLLPKEGYKWGIVFGPERTGLTNDELTLCSAILSISVNPSFPSLNLGQAVTLTAYEWGQARKSPKENVLRTGETLCATRQDIGLFLEALEADLDRAHYWRVPSKKPRMKRLLYNIFTRLDITQQELKTLRGVFQSLKFSGAKEIGPQKDPPRPSS